MARFFSPRFYNENTTVFPSCQNPSIILPTTSPTRREKKGLQKNTHARRVIGESQGKNGRCCYFCFFFFILHCATKGGKNKVSRLTQPGGMSFFFVSFHFLLHLTSVMLCFRHKTHNFGCTVPADSAAAHCSEAFLRVSTIKRQTVRHR